MSGIRKSDLLFWMFDTRIDRLHANLYFQDSPMHEALFWVAVAVLQLDEVNLYSAGTALLEQNLHTLDNLRVFNDKVSWEIYYSNSSSSNQRKP